MHGAQRVVHVADVQQPQLHRQLLERRPPGLLRQPAARAQVPDLRRGVVRVEHRAERRVERRVRHLLQDLRRRAGGDKRGRGLMTPGQRSGVVTQE